MMQTYTVASVDVRGNPMPTTASPVTPTVIVKPTRDQRDRFRWLLANVAWKTAGQNVVDVVTRAARLVKSRTMSREQMQWVIDRLAQLRLRAIPDGFYLLAGRRYKLRTPTEGKRSGFTSVYAVNDTEEALLRGQQRRAVLDALRDRHVEAALRFGQETQRCPYCNQQLDDPVSRRVGAGQRCAAARAIPWK